jgi:hypothetical protein
MTDETTGVYGSHPAENIEVAHHHFNIIKVVRDAKAEFEAKNPGKTAAYFYAPEPILYLVDRAVKSRTLSAGNVPREILENATVTNIFGMELISILGTCITVTAEPVHEDEPEAVVGPVQTDQLPN